jgi:hypothetical protein
VASLHVEAVNEAVVERAPYNHKNVSELYMILSRGGRLELARQSLEYVWNIR